MSLPSKPNLTSIGTGARSTEEPKNITNVNKQNAWQDDYYEYLDKNGGTYPGPLNNGLEGNFIANQAIRSEHLRPQEGLVSFVGSNKTSISTAGAYEDYAPINFDITTTYANAYLVLDWHYEVVVNSGQRDLRYKIFIEASPGGSYTEIRINPSTGDVPVIKRNAATYNNSASGRLPLYTRTLGVAGTYNVKMQVTCANATTGFSFTTSKHLCYYRVTNGKTS